MNTFISTIIIILAGTTAAGWITYTFDHVVSALTMALS